LKIGFQKYAFRKIRFKKAVKTSLAFAFAVGLQTVGRYAEADFTLDFYPLSD
tara:strand:+ start:279 stop:434 length:156 start_codon:yes stop_codon:yes gene_type:complete